MPVELGLLGLFLALWTVALAALFGILPTDGLLNLSFYQLYGVAAFLGWLSGNVFIHRSKKAPRQLRSRLLLIYLLGPPGLIYLLRSLADVEIQARAPLAAVYACGVYVVFFLVPVTLKGTSTPRSRFRG